MKKTPTKKSHFFGIVKNLYFSLGCQPKYAKNHFCDKMFVETSVRENVNPLGRPTYDKFQGCICSDPCNELKKENFIKLSILFILITVLQ